MDRICRICLESETTQEFMDIYRKPSHKIALKIFLISHVKIIELHECPALICSQCVKELYQCFQFRKKIQTSDEYFRNKLEILENNLWKQTDECDEVEELLVCDEDEESFKNEENFDNEIKIEALDEEFEYEEALDEVIDTNQDADEEEVSASETTLNESSKPRRGRKVKNVKRSYNRLVCKICGITLSRRQRLVQHERLHFLEATKLFYQCDVCGKQFNQRFSVIPHFQKYHNFKLGGAKERWKCAICENKTLPAGKMEVHYRKFHAEFYSNSIDSREIVESPRKMLRKIDKNSKTPKTQQKSKNWFLCGLCGNSFTSSYRYHKHLNDIHGVTEHEINQRDENVALPATVANNQVIKKSKNVPCQVCGKIFASVTTCKAHEKTHLDVQYVCDLCGNSFKVKAYLTAHVQKIHMKLKRFKCTICSKEFIHRELLNYHVRKHLNIRNYQCQFCQKTFVRKACMLIHERIHINLRPYSCKYCDRSFIHHSDHRRHELRHKAAD